MKKSVAIVIPYFKPEFFRETLHALENQTQKGFHVYIGDDASPFDATDFTAEILRNVSYSYIRYEENFGGKDLVSQWERVLAEVQDEEWVMILGDDDVLSPNSIEEFYKNLNFVEENGCNVVKISQCWMDETGNRTTEFLSYPKKLDPYDHLSYKILQGARSSLSENFFRKSVLQKVGFQHFPLAWAVDDVAILEVSDGKPICFLENAKAFVRISNINISGKSDNRIEKREAKTIFEKYLIRNHYKKLTKDTLRKLIDDQIYLKYHQNIPLGVCLAKMYWHLGDYRKLAALPKTYLILNKILK